MTHIQKAKNAKYTSPEAVAELQDSLSKVVDDELIFDLRQSEFFSIMLDESTDRSTEKTLMLYVCYLKQGKSVTRFLSVVELLGGTAEVIFESVKAIFALYKVPFDKCISIATDGASVMTGIRSGVTTRFSEQNPFIIKSHCIAHRLALAASQATNSVNYLKKYQGTINEIYKYYHYSCKHMSELKAMALIFDKAQKKFEEVFGTRWLSFEGAVGALLQNFDILVVLGGYLLKVLWVLFFRTLIFWLVVSCLMKKVVI